MTFKKVDYQEILNIMKNTSFKYLHIKVNYMKNIPSSYKDVKIDSYFYEYVLHIKNKKLQIYKIQSIFNGITDLKFYDPPAREKDYVPLIQQKINSFYETTGQALLKLMVNDFELDEVEVFFTMEWNDTKLLIYKTDYTNK